MEKATLAIAVITMLIALGQLILAYVALDKSKMKSMLRWRRPNIDWILIGLTMALAAYGVGKFLTAPFEKMEVYYFGAYIFVASMGFSMFVLKLGLVQAGKHMAGVRGEWISVKSRIAMLEQRLEKQDY